MLAAVCVTRLMRFAAAILAVAGIAAISLGPQSEASPNGSVTYTAHVFMRGMKVTVPNAGWRVHEDHPGEFNLAAPPGGDNATHIHFWLDPIATAPHGIVLPNVGRTPAALVAWLRHNPNFVVSAPTRRRIAHGLRTTSLALDVSADAPKEDPTCTAPCVTYFVFRGLHYNFPYGTAHGFPIRLYFASLRHGTKTHTFTISVDTPSPAAFKAVVPLAEKISRASGCPRRSPVAR